MGEVKDIQFKSADHVIKEIENMNVKGGSPFGRAAAWAYKLISDQESFSSKEELQLRYDEVSGKMLKLKPTMATIYNTKKMVYDLLNSNLNNKNVSEIKYLISSLCTKIINHSEEAVEKLGEYGANLIKDGDKILMHSYSSALMSVFTKAAESGKTFSVICTESRPLRESRLAAQILQEHGVNVTYIIDAAIWEFMPQADYVMMGADSITWEGSVANKMGTSMVSKLAQECKKPVYILSEMYKMDSRTREGHRVELERRTIYEIIEEDDFDQLDRIEVINQFFDITPAYHIRGIVCEFGIISPTSAYNYWNQLEEKVKK